MSAKGLIGPIEADLDCMPWLTYKLKDAGRGNDPAYAVRVIDAEAGTMALLEEHLWTPWYDYRAYDLRKVLNVTGRRKLLVKFYYLGIRPVDKQFFIDDVGDFLLLDFLRLEE